MKKMFKLPNIGCGYMYFYIHFVTEIACFFYLSSLTDNIIYLWLIPLIYDGLAFVPQGLLGKINDNYPKINFSIIGIILMIIALLLFNLDISIFISLTFLCLGNICIHVRGAEITLKNSNGKLSHSAIFVSGGSFGVVTGKLLANRISFWYIIFILLTSIPFILIAEKYSNSKMKPDCHKFNYNNKKLNPYLVIFLATFVVIIRGYMGYGIPTSWNKTNLELIIFYVTMGLGKAFGGILSDYFGIRKVAIISTLICIPFLCFGDNLMIISIIGVMFFSMTMSITLAILTSCLPKNPGLAFGLTTIGLFLGTIPVFFFKVSMTFNILFIIIFSIVCSFILSKIISKGVENG